jgi:hypothetical protein
MDWQLYADSVRCWIAERSRIPVDDVTWEGEPVGMLGTPNASLRLLGNSGPYSQLLTSDETRYLAATDPANPTGLPIVQIIGNRAFTLSIVVTTRDYTPWGRAFRYLERVRDSLSLPSTLSLFSSLGVSLDSPAELVDLQRVFDKRQESQASLDLYMQYAFDTLCECQADGSDVETIDTIEHVIVSGSVCSHTQGRPDSPFAVGPDTIDKPPVPTPLLSARTRKGLTSHGR